MYESFKNVAVGRRINLLFRLSMMHIRNEMKKLGFGAGDYAFLILLFVKDGLSQDEITRQMRVDKSYTARALAKLEAAGMVERRPDPEEYRVKRVFLGQKARAIETDFFEILKGWHDTLVEGIDPDRLKQVLEDVDHMIENAENRLGLKGT